MRIKLMPVVVLSMSAFAFNVQAADKMDANWNWNKGSLYPKADYSGEGKVAIDRGVKKVAGIARNQNTRAKIHPAFSKTSRPCPPFCIQPMRAFAPAQVETIGEREILDAAERIAKGDKTLMLMDNRTPVWTTADKGGTIPHSVNIPFTKINTKAVTKDPDAVIEILTSRFNVKEQDGLLNFNNAKTLYMFCNGMWCGQSPAGIRALLSLGYPESKLKWYRGGMQDWHILGLATVDQNGKAVVSRGR